MSSIDTIKVDAYENSRRITPSPSLQIVVWLFDRKQNFGQVHTSQPEKAKTNLYHVYFRLTEAGFD